jgi:hypothetical protein
MKLLDCGDLQGRTFFPRVPEHCLYGAACAQSTSSQNTEKGV